MDEAGRCMDSIFYMLLFSEFSNNISINLFSFVEKFYSYYPALYIAYWPPLNQIITSIFYTLFGINKITSRLSVFIFSILSIIYLYKLISEFYDKKSIKFVLPIFLASPYFVYFSTINFIEMPLVFFTIICTYYFLKTFVKNSDHSLILGTLLGLSFLVKWNMIVLYITFLLFLFIRKRDELFKKKFLKTSILFFAFAIPFFVLMLFTGGINAVLANISSGVQFSIGDIYFYLISPFFIFFPIFTLIGYYGLFSSYKKRNLPQYFFILLFFVISYLIFTFLFQMKLHRFLINFYLPFFPILIYIGLNKVHTIIKNNNIMIVIFSIILFLQVIYWFYVTPVGSTIFDTNKGFEEAADYVTRDLKENSNILLLNDDPTYVYHLFRKLPLFSHHIVRLRWCDNITDFSSYLQDNNVIYILREQDQPRYFTELDSFNKTVVKRFEIYKTDLVYFQPTKICNGYCKIDIKFCSY